MVQWVTMLLPTQVKAEDAPEFGWQVCDRLAAQVA